MRLSRGVRRTITLLVFISILLLTQKTRIEKMFYPLKYESTVLKYSEMYDVDPNLVMAMIKIESKFESQAVSDKGAIGLMQIMPDTGVWASQKIGMESFEAEDLYDYERNIQIGTWYISHLIGEFDGDTRNAVLAYNGGIGNVYKWLENENYSKDGVNVYKVPFPETENYVERVIKAQGIYKEIYGG